MAIYLGEGNSDLKPGQMGLFNLGRQPTQWWFHEEINPQLQMSIVLMSEWPLRLMVDNDT